MFYGIPGEVGTVTTKKKASIFFAEISSRFIVSKNFEVHTDSRGTP